MDDVPECPQRQLVAWSDGGPAPQRRAEAGLAVAALQAAGGFTDILGHLVSRISFLALCRFSHILALCPVGRHFFFSLCFSLCTTYKHLLALPPNSEEIRKWN